MNKQQVLIGCDVESVSRFQRLLDDTHFLKRYLHPQELTDLQDSSDPVRRLATLMSVKEALRKALWLQQRPELRRMRVDMRGDEWQAHLTDPECELVGTRIQVEYVDDQVAVWLATGLRN